MKKSKAKKLIAGISSLCLAAGSIPAVGLSAAAANTVYGDANCDGKVTIADAVFIMQSLALPAKYQLSTQGADNGDVCDRGDGITAKDALSIQRYMLGIIKELPESWKEGTVDPVTDETLIHLKDDKIEVEGQYAEANGSIVTITHSGSFIIDGTLDDGQICVNIPDEAADPETVKIFLNGASITGKTRSAVLVQNAENTSINVMDGTENYIGDGGEVYTGGGALIEAKDDITFKGGDENTGALEINALANNAVVCNNDIKFTGGKYTIKSLDETNKTNGVNGKKSVTIKDNAVVDIEAEGDGIKSSKGDVSVKSGELYVKAGNDAVQAETTIDISGGTVIVGGDRGLTAVDGVNISGGYVVATATDNQVDTALLSGTTQGTKLFNMVACEDSKDGTWKKANSFAGDTYGFMKKYAFVLISDETYTSGTTKMYENDATGSAVMYGNGNFNFKQTDVVTVYNDVNPNGAVPPATPDVPDDTEGYTITFDGASIKSNAPESACTVSNGTLTIKEPGVFALSGSGKDVQVVVDVDKTKYPDGVVELDLIGVDLTNSTTAPIYVANIGDEVQIVAKKGTENTISDGTQHTQTYKDSDGNENTVEGAVFARDDIKFKGTGSLVINGNTDDAVVCKNDIKIYNGNITINAVDDGIRGKDSVTIGKPDDTDYSGLNISVQTKTGDGIKSTATDSGNGVVTINGGAVDIKAYADGIQAEQNVVITGGDINIYTYTGSGYTASGTTTGGNTGGGRPGGGGWNPGGGMGQDGNPNKVTDSAKGIKSVGIYDAAGTTWQSGGDITITGGNITIDASDDAVHCGGSMTITGGQFLIKSADDALHSDHDLTLGTKGGSDSDFGIFASKCYEGVEGLNIYQYSGTVIVKSDDDGYNAAGGSDGSGTQNPGGWNPGGWGGGFPGGGGNTGNYSINILGGVAIVQSPSGDHDAFDSNGSLTVSGGVVIANGWETLDSDGTKTVSGGTVLTADTNNTSSINSGTQFTVADSSGKVIVSFITMQNMPKPTVSKSTTTVTMYTGGTISGGTDLIALDEAQKVYTNGTISGGTKVG